MYKYGQRLDHRGFAEAHVFGKRDDVVRGHDGIFPQQTGTLCSAQKLRVQTEVRTADPARFALSARERRLNSDGRS